MDIRKIDDTFSVAGQITPKDVALISSMGFKSIICNRPDGESQDQPLFESIEAAARNDGMEARYLPVIPGGPDAAEVAAFDKAFARLPKPVLAYCRSGNRSLAAWKAGPGVNAE